MDLLKLAQSFVRRPAPITLPFSFLGNLYQRYETERAGQILFGEADVSQLRKMCRADITSVVALCEAYLRMPHMSRYVREMGWCTTLVTVSAEALGVPYRASESNHFGYYAQVRYGDVLDAARVRGLCCISVPTAGRALIELTETFSHYSGRGFVFGLMPDVKVNGELTISAGYSPYTGMSCRTISGSRDALIEVGLVVGQGERLDTRFIFELSQNQED